MAWGVPAASGSGMAPVPAFHHLEVLGPLRHPSCQRGDQHVQADLVVCVVEGPPSNEWCLVQCAPVAWYRLVAPWALLAPQPWTGASGVTHPPEVGLPPCHPRAKQMVHLALGGSAGRDCPQAGLGSRDAVVAWQAEGSSGV